MTCSSLYQVVQVTKVSNCTNHKKELTLLSGCLNIEWSVKNAIFTNSTFLLHYQHIRSLSCDPILRRERTQEDAFAYDKVTKVSGVQHKLKNLRFHACYRLLLSYDDKCGKASIQCTDTSHPKVSVSNISLLNDEKKKRSLLKWSDPSCDLMTGPIERYVILISKNSSFDIKEKLECYFPCNQLELKYFIVGFYYVKIRYMDHLQRSSPYSGMQKIYIAIEPFKVDYTILWMMILSLIALFIVGILYNKFKNAKICFTMAKKGSKQISFFSASAHEPKQKKSSYKPYKDMAASTHFNNQVYFHYVDISQKSTSSALTMNHSSIFASINCESVESFYWKRPCERISISEDVLGEGQFGKVYKCRIEMAQSVMTAAVKVLKKSQIHHQSFHKELKIMAKIGHHDNVVNLLGACKRDLHLYVFLEYLENGDLRSYLRKNRTLDENGFLISKSIAYYQLVKFAYEICEGMIYLGSHRIIHRDLAARNIMIGDKMEAKIGDFGLAREENIYVKNTPGRLPWRWMAIESLTSRIYTSKSDVWSFGILMWEIITLGGTPYWQIDIKDHNDLKRALLDQNYRMPKPKNCDEKMYNIMTLSWNVDPNSRLNFEEIKVKLESVLAYYEGISLDWNQNTSNDEYYEEVDDSICDSISCAENYSKSYTL